MTERQGVGILYNIPHLAESFITHCLLYRFTHRAPLTNATHSEIVNIFYGFAFPAYSLLTPCFFDLSLSTVKPRLSILQTIVDILYSFVHINHLRLRIILRQCPAI